MKSSFRYLSYPLMGACSILLQASASAAPVSLNLYLEYTTDQRARAMVRVGNSRGIGTARSWQVRRRVDTPVIQP